MGVIYALMGLCGGVLFGMQTAINAKLGRVLGGPIPATWMSFSVGWVALTLATAATLRVLPSGEALRQAPFYIFVAGGLLGATFLSISVFLVPRIGSASTFCWVIAGQLLAALIIDRMGLFGLQERGLTLIRVLGTGLVALGAFLVATR